MSVHQLFYGSSLIEVARTIIENHVIGQTLIKKEVLKQQIIGKGPNSAPHPLEFIYLCQPFTKIYNENWREFARLRIIILGKHLISASFKVMLPFSDCFCFSSWSTEKINIGEDTSFACSLSFKALKSPEALL